MGKDKLVIGTRGSALALTQSEWVRDKLVALHPELEVELKVVHTKGDKILDTALSKIGDKGLFTREIEQQLLEENIDLAVHSLKDLPTEQPEGLSIAVVTEREDPADVLVSKDNLNLAELPKGAKILSGSLRRRAQLLHRRDDLDVVDVRGNIHTRLRKLEEGDAAAIVMAAAGLQRAGLAERITERFEPRDFIPGCGQGALGLEIRRDDQATAELIEPLEERVSRITTTAERSLLAHLEGGCQIPIGAYAQLEENKLYLWGMIADLQGEKLLTAQGSGTADKAQQLGIEVAQELIDMGGKIILDEIRQDS
jgi:hydroxymethylbilane synthase